MEALQSNASLLVYTSILALAPNIDSGDVAVIINRNFPDYHMNSDVVDFLLGHLSAQLPQWSELLREVDTNTEEYGIIYNCLNNCQLRLESIPTEEITVVGLQRTIERVIFHACQYAIDGAPIYTSR